MVMRTRPLCRGVLSTVFRVSQSPRRGVIFSASTSRCSSNSEAATSRVALDGSVGCLTSSGMRSSPGR